MILEVLFQNNSTVNLRSTAPSDCGAQRVTLPDNFANASGSILGGNAFERRMGVEESLALGKRDGVGLNLRDLVELGARWPNQVVRDRNHHFGLDA
jgi:hypothetical protein